MASSELTTSPWKTRCKQFGVIVTTLTACVGMVAGVVGVMNSDLFLVKVVEVTDLQEVTPLSSEEILRIAKVPTESTNLFSLKLKGIEHRLLSHPWVRGVVITKRFPNTVSIAVKFREPLAVMQTKAGVLFFLDQDGAIFSEINLKSNPNLPVILETEEPRKNLAMELIRAWRKHGLDETFPISTIEDRGEKGMRALVTYPLKTKGRGRTWIEVGQSFDDEFDIQLVRLKEVLSYLSRNGIPVRHVLADLGKKIVVRIDRRS